MVGGVSAGCSTSCLPMLTSSSSSGAEDESPSLSALWISTTVCSAERSRLRLSGAFGGGGCGSLKGVRSSVCWGTAGRIFCFDFVVFTRRLWLLGSSGKAPKASIRSISCEVSAQRLASVNQVTIRIYDHFSKRFV